MKFTIMSVHFNTILFCNSIGTPLINTLFHFEISIIFSQYIPQNILFECGVEILIRRDISVHKEDRKGRAQFEKPVSANTDKRRRLKPASVSHSSEI